MAIMFMTKQQNIEQFKKLLAECEYYDFTLL